MSAELVILQGHVYRGKRPRSAGQFYPYVNDRQVMRFNGETVQYDSPSVHNGRKYPCMSVEEFRKWASHDVTDILPPGEWQQWPIPKEQKHGE